MKKYYKLPISFLLLILQTVAANSQVLQKPNIVLILADDLGYSDLGCYGSEISTPNLDKLASGGLRVKQFYNNSICAPSRASLLTGQYQHKAGVGYFNVDLGLPAYQGYLNKSSLTLAEVLKSNGYTTLMCGKWHVGNEEPYWPNQRGFDHFFGFISAQSPYFISSTSGQSPRGMGMGALNLMIDNKHYTPSGDNYYLTDDFGDHAVHFLDDQKQEKKPFFLYMAFNAPHIPLQALPEDKDKYKGKYDQGWDAIRNKRTVRQVQLGIKDAKQTVAQKDPKNPDWKSLTAAQQRTWINNMETYAAMIDRMDQNVGKVIRKIHELGQDNNTLIVFISDNGAPSDNVNSASPGNRIAPVGRNVQTPLARPVQVNFALSTPNTPLKEYKNTMYEGGISSPFIAYWPGMIKAGQIKTGNIHLIDIAPTFYSIVKANYPDVYNGMSSFILPGVDFSQLLLKGREVQRQEPLFWERAGNRAVRDGNWKLVSKFPSETWELYDLSKDRGEINNQAATHADIVKRLSNAYGVWAKATGVVDFKLLQSKVRQGNMRR